MRRSPPSNLPLTLAAKQSRSDGSQAAPLPPPVTAASAPEPDSRLVAVIMMSTLWSQRQQGVTTGEVRWPAGSERKFVDGAYGSAAGSQAKHRRRAAAAPDLQTLQKGALSLAPPQPTLQTRPAQVAASARLICSRCLKARLRTCP